MNQVTTKYLSYLINNYKFNTKYIDEERITQNNNTCVDAIIKCKSSTKYINIILGMITYVMMLLWNKNVPPQLLWSSKEKSH